MFSLQRNWSNPEQLSATLLIRHQTVAVTVEQYIGNSRAPLPNTRCTLYTESGVDTGLFSDTDANGLARFTIPLNNYKAKVEHLGNEFFSEPFDWFDTTLSIPHGTLNLHPTSVGQDAKKATVKLCNPEGKFLGVITNTNNSGNTSFELPPGSYKLYINHKGDKYWSDILHTQPYMKVLVELNLSKLAKRWTNTPLVNIKFVHFVLTRGV